jgi:GNAT superfamily N-acetyltransferase
MTIQTRDANDADAGALSALLNRIIEIGGTTAYQTPFTEARFADEFLNPSTRIACTLALCEDRPCGFQFLGRPTKDAYPTPEAWAFIASFVAPGMQGHGIGRALWTGTLSAARSAGVQAIDATIRADNFAGLRFYSGLGFTEWDVIRGKPLRDGTPVDRIRKVFRLE